MNEGLAFFFPGGLKFHRFVKKKTIDEIESVLKSVIPVLQRISGAQPQSQPTKTRKVGKGPTWADLPGYVPPEPEPEKDEDVVGWEDYRATQRREAMERSKTPTRLTIAPVQIASPVEESPYQSKILFDGKADYYD